MSLRAHCATSMRSCGTRGWADPSRAAQQRLTSWLDKLLFLILMIAGLIMWVGNAAAAMECAISDYISYLLFDKQQTLGRNLWWRVASAPPCDWVSVRTCHLHSLDVLY